MTESGRCAIGLNTLSNILGNIVGLNPVKDKGLDISFTDPFFLNTHLCKLLNRYVYQGTCPARTIYQRTGYTTVIPTLYIDGKDMGTLENLKIQEIKALAEPSQTVYNKHMRTAFEIKGNRINLDFELPTQIQEMAPMGSDISAKLNKLVIYKKGGLFAEHSDNQYGEDHIGTLVICLPVPYEGGGFILSDNGNKIKLPFDEMIKGGKIPWVAFYTDMKHQVKVAKSGMRMTLQFELKVKPKDKKDPDNNLFKMLEPLKVCDYKYKLHDFNQELMENIKDKLKTILAAPKTQPSEVKPADYDWIIKKRERPDDDEPFQLEQPQPTKQPKPDSELDREEDEYEEEEEDDENDEEMELNDSEDENEDEENEYSNPDGIAILLSGKYRANFLSPGTLKGIDSAIYSALKDEFRVEVKHVVIEQHSDCEGGYHPIEVVALSQFKELKDKDELERDNKHVTTDNFICYEREEEKRFEEKVKKVCLVAGVLPKEITKLFSQEGMGERFDYTIHSYMQAALFIYPR